MRSNYRYDLDAVGNRTGVHETDGNRVTWTYDANGQLINEHRSGINAYNTTFIYDAVGNRVVKNEDGMRTTSVYDAADQLATSQSSQGVATYIFDANGNRHLVVQPDASRTTYAWDYENQNTGVEMPDGSRVTMTYDAQFRRISKEI